MQGMARLRRFFYARYECVNDCLEMRMENGTEIIFQKADGGAF